MAKKWIQSDRPSDSEFLECGPTRGARVMPSQQSHGFEWTIWIGPKGKRVLHNRGETKTRAGAKAAVARICKRTH